MYSELDLTTSEIIIKGVCVGGGGGGGSGVLGAFLPLFTILLVFN